MRSRAWAAAALLAALLLSACASAASPVTQPITVPATIDRSASVTLAISSGDLRVSGGAAALVEGSATYPASDGKTRAEVGSREATAGRVTTAEIGQGKVSLAPGRRLFDLRLNGGLPIELNASVGSGNAELDLALADPKDLGVTGESGNLSLRLSGPHPSLSRVRVSLASGETSVTADGEYPALESFAVKSGSGNVRVDLAGTWRTSFKASVDARSGNVTLVLPRSVGVRVLGSPGSGSVSAEGFMQAGEGWVRAADQPSESTLTVEVTLTSGNLTLLAR